MPATKVTGGSRQFNSHYDRLSISLHWIMLVLLVAVYACMELREFYPKGSDIREGMKSWHFMLGLTVLALVIVRIAVRALRPAPPITPKQPSWQRWLARSVHLLLYAFMIGMPIAGWIILSASGKTIPFFGLALPPLTGENQALAGQVKELHETAASVGYFLIGFHAAAALFHHYFVKDNTLRRMLPGRKSHGGSL
jgi:superoxide oxidase